jgi:hypothetical protein
MVRYEESLETLFTFAKSKGGVKGDSYLHNYHRQCPAPEKAGLFYVTIVVHTRRCQLPEAPHPLSVDCTTRQKNKEKPA